MDSQSEFGAASGGGESPSALLTTLRGRLHVVILLAVLFAVPLGFLGFKSADPMFKASGELMMQQRDSLFNTPLDNTGALREYIQAEAGRIRSRAVFLKALDRPELSESGFPLGEDGVAKLGRLVKVSPPVSSGQLITISAEDPNRWFVTNAVNAVMAGYIELHEDEQRARREAGVQQAERRVSNVRDRIAQLEEESAPLFAEFGSVEALERQLESLDGLRIDLAAERRELNSSIETNLAVIDERSARVARYEAGQDVEGPSVLELSLDDERMTELEEERHLVATELQADLASGSLPTHPKVLTQQAKLRELDLLIEDRVRALVARWWARQRGSLDELRTQVTAERRRLDGVEKELSKLDGQRFELTTRIQQVREFSEKIDSARIELAEYVRLRSDIEQQLAEESLGQARIFESAELPEADDVSSDPRFMRAGAGAMLGIAIAIGTVVLSSGLKHRIRFMDEFTPERLGASCLGAVPEIRRLTASSFTEIESCVDPMRARIEVLAMKPGSRGSQVLAVTSPGPTDGKSTVARALASSFARAGHRTVLIDADPDGRATTAAYAMSGEPGFVDYLVAPDLTLIQASGKSGLWILPAGRVDQRTVNSSYAAVARMVDDLRGHFEQIVIDTGGILGSTESSLVGRAADSMVLVVSRGKPLEMAERALARINEIGAHCIGVIFNRAEPSDFVRASIAVSSVRRDLGDPGIVPVQEGQEAQQDSDQHDPPSRSSARA